MPGISVTDNYDALLSTTLRNYRKKLIDNIFADMPFLKWLMRKRGNGKEVGTFDLQDGGTHIVEHLMYGKNTTFAFYSGYEQLDTTPQEGITIAQFDWRELGGTVSISRAEMRKNSGESQLINLLQAKITQAEMSIRDKLTEKLFANITQTPAKDVDSVLLHVSNTPSTTTTGQVSGQTYTWWRNQQANCGAFATNLVNKMMTVYNNCAAQGSPPNAIVCTQTAWEYYAQLGVDLKRITNEKLSLDLGFDVLSYRGADMFWDPAFASNTPVTGDSMLFLNTKHMRFVTDRQTNFVTTDFIEPDNQTAKVAKVLWMGNLTINKRSAHGLLHGITAS
jgi:hypothetical protein